MPNKLHFYTKYSKEKIKISDKPFASGGEGAIYAIASPRNYSHLVAKIYYPEKRTKDREAKMHYLMKHPPITFQKGQPPSIGWVQDVVYKEQRFLGILLIKIEGKKLTKLTLAKLSRRADKAWQRFAFQDPNALKLRLRTCFNLAVVIYQIHEKGQYVLVDLKPDNILMQPNGLLAVVDMDSVEVVEGGNVIFAAPVATPEYTPPEHYIGKRTVIEETWDRFSLGVIFYQLLLGLHPFAASSHPPYDNLVSIHDKIQHHLYVHNPNKKEFLKVIPPPHKRYNKLPIEVQQLFQDCFALGAENPFSRPSALDWCATLANLLNLPFKGIPNYNLPLKQLPKIDFEPSSLYFKPTLFIKKLDQCPQYTPSVIDPNSLKEIKASIIAPIETTASLVLVQTVQKELWETMKISYKNYLTEHRNSLWVTILIFVSLTVLCLLFPSLFIWGAILTFFAFPKLIFRSSKDIVHRIGKTVLPTSTDDILSKQNDFIVSNKQLTSTIQTLKTKKEALTGDLNQLILEVNKSATQYLKKLAHNKEHLPAIRQKINTQQLLIDSILPFNPWLEQELKLQLAETRTKELEMYSNLYKDFSKQFSTQLQEKKGAIKNTFRDFNNKKFKLEKSIALQKGKLLTIKDESIKQQMLIDYEEALKANSLNHAQKLDAYQKINQAPLPTEVKISEPQEVLEQKLKIQLKYNKRRKQSALKKAKKKLGKNFQVNLKKYLDLLYNSGVATELHFAQHSVQERFKLFQEDISILSLKDGLQHKLSSLFTPEATSQWSIIPLLNSSNLSELENKQIGMLNEWTYIEKELQKLQEKVKQLQFQPLDIDDIFITQWTEEIKESILKIKFSENTYHDFQKSFYNDSQIAQIYKELKNYRQAEQVKQSLEYDYLNKILLLNKERPISEERKRLNQELETYQQSSIVEEAESARKITLTYEQELVNLEKKWDLDIQNTNKQLKEETEELAQLNIDFQSFEDAIETTVLDAEEAYPKELEKTRLTFDTIYKEHQTTYDERLKSITKSHDLLTKNYLTLIPQIKKHRTQQLENVEYLSIHRENLDKIQEIETEIKAIHTQITTIEQSIENTIEEKVKIDTLVKWQENYSTKIYIKDLLLNKVEQFRAPDDKKA